MAKELHADDYDDDGMEDRLNLERRMRALRKRFPKICPDTNIDDILDAILLEQTNVGIETAFTPDLIGRLGSWLFPVYADVCSSVDRTLLVELSQTWDADDDIGLRNQLVVVKNRLQRVPRSNPEWLAAGQANWQTMFTATGFWQIVPVLDLWTHGRAPIAIQGFLDLFTSPEE